MTAPLTDTTFSVDANISGIALHVTTDHEVVAGVLQSRLGPLRSEVGAVDAVVFDIRQGRLALAGHGWDDGRAVYDSDLGEVRYLDATDTLLIDCGPIDCGPIDCGPIDCGSVVVRADVTRGHVDIRYETGADAELALAAHPLFTLPLLEVLKRRDRFSLHAACVADGQRGILLPGASGSGKSTLSIALTLAGLTFLADDMVFLEPHSTPPTVSGFPDDLDLTDETARRFPHLAHLVGHEPWGGRPKHQVSVDTALGAEPGRRCHPSVMLFPAITGRRTSSLSELPAGEALLELAPNVLLTDAETSQRHLDALGSLVRGVPCYRFGVGTDLDEAAATGLGVDLVTADRAVVLPCRLRVAVVGPGRLQRDALSRLLRCATDIEIARTDVAIEALDGNTHLDVAIVGLTDDRGLGLLARPADAVWSRSLAIGPARVVAWDAEPPEFVAAVRQTGAALVAPILQVADA